MADKNDIKKGRELLFKYGDTKVGRVISFSLSVDGEVIDVSDIDSGEWNEFLRGRKSWTISLTANRVEDAGDEQSTITSDFIDSGSEGTIEFGPETPETGDVLYSGDVLVTSFTVDNSGSDDAVGSSWEFQGTGALTRIVTA